MDHMHAPVYCFLHCLHCHLLLLMFWDLALWGNVRDVSNVCICISCHWGHCHEKTLDNSHDKQKYFGNPQSLDAAEEEPSKQGAEEDPVLSVENSGRGSDALRLESKLIWPELCFCGKINSQTSGSHSSLLSRVCFLLVTLIELGEWLQMTGKCSSHAFFLFCPSARTDLIHACASSQCSQSVQWVTAERDISGFWQPFSWPWPLLRCSPTFLTYSVLCQQHTCILALLFFLPMQCLTFGGTDSYEYISDSQAVLDLRLRHSSSWCL